MPKQRDLPQVSFAPQKPLGFEFEIVPLERLIMRAPHVDPTTPHRARFMQLIRVLEGNAEHVVDFERIRFRANDLLLVHESRVHQFVRPDAWRGRLYVFTWAFLYSNREDREIFENSRVLDATYRHPLIRIPG